MMDMPFPMRCPCSNPPIFETTRFLLYATRARCMPNSGRSWSDFRQGLAMPSKLHPLLSHFGSLHSSKGSPMFTQLRRVADVCRPSILLVDSRWKRLLICDYLEITLEAWVQSNQGRASTVH